MMNIVFLSKSLPGGFMVILYLKKSSNTANGVWIIYNIYCVMTSMPHLQMQGESTMSTPMDNFATFGSINEVCYVVPCGVPFNVVKPFYCYY